MPVYAEDATDSAVVEVTPTPEVSPEVTPTIEPTVTPEVTTTPEATPTVELTPSITPTEEVTITPEPTVTPEVSPEVTPTEEVAQEEPQNNSPPTEQSSSSDSTPTQTETTTPTTLPEPLTIIAELEQTVTPNTTPTLTTDKGDYFPTDTVYINGTNFLPNTNYSLHIFSTDNPLFSINPDVTSDENGNISYSFKLDGNYRPTYSIEAYNENGEIITSFNFTDTNQTNTLQVCHSTSSHSNPYELITPDISGVESGHRGHNGGVYPAEPWGDIFPPYSYTTEECPANDTDYTSTDSSKACSI
jgi:hypothetical protein